MRGTENFLKGTGQRLCFVYFFFSSRRRHTRSLRDWSFRRVLFRSGTVMVGQDLSREQRYDYLRKFGVGSSTGIPLPGESAGLLAQPDQWDGRQEFAVLFGQGDRKSTRLNSSHVEISYAVFCLKKKK